MTRLLLLLLVALWPIRPARTQDAPRHEFRGVWIATVANLDWPSSGLLAPRGQQAELAGMLDRLADLGVNAVFFQVRSECDAMYDSAVEPWSRFLTGEQGRPPEPRWDPLTFAVDEAHRRGMALHAWINPLRCVRDVARDRLAASHPARRRPEWMLTIASDSEPGRAMKILNPGLEAVRDYVTGIVLDVARRYDVDGIHFDDYFYPYPPLGVGTEDLADWRRDPRGLALADWRRDNVNRLIRGVSRALSHERPDVLFGISPFGIWRSGVPPGVVGTSAADEIYADARAWLDNGWIDYLAPQLYWDFGGGQDFGRLVRWWASVADGRHVYPGLAAYKADAATHAGTLLRPGVVPDQIRYARGIGGVQGHAVYRASNLTRFEASGLARAIGSQLYGRPALLPPMRHLLGAAPEPVRSVRAREISGAGILVDWQPAQVSFVRPRRFALFRVQGRAPVDPARVVADTGNLVAVVHAPRGEYTDPVAPSSEPYHYVVVAVSANAAESVPSEPVSVVVTGRPAAAPGPPVAEGPTGEVLRVTVTDRMGRELACFDPPSIPAGAPGDVARRVPGPPGLYFVLVETAGARAVHPVLRRGVTGSASPSAPSSAPARR